ncbi:NAD(P)/FAD-dependent oxidoreductase [Rariglobus hedericola]|uniref:NADH:ubiquinone reductase (non-electrogenic) n=1 Tax=Rariglobus hedericola TaxID=2597822 RepID=A0A556QMF7_9BACT|nr:NAD(P)/FAD-dependent oxidoreductase [Rariglobus hedericola]TSJ77805.1 NAD(P)/FAD-dependent oxidoreductase [Rariglobus hedericola]
MSTETITDSRTHVIVLGGGFAGLAACRQLNDPRVRVTLVDRQNHHLFQPLLYQVATAGLAGPDIAQPLRHILSDQDNVTTLMDEVLRVDLDAKRVELGHGALAYDYLIVALGARTGYFGRNEWARHAPGLKTLAEATNLRRDLLLAFERAETTSDQAERDRLLSFVVVGGGPTGVETAGALAELARRVLVDDFRRIDPSRAHVHLVEAAPKLLTMFTPEQSEYTRKRLEKMGVTVHLGSPVSEVGEGYVVVSGQRLESAVTIWAAGVEGSPVTRTLTGATLDRGGRVQPSPDLSLPDRREVFAAGDLVALTDVKGVRVPGVAPAATQMGGHAARQILADLNRKERAAFVYTDKGSMATIGRSAAVAYVFGIRWKGFPAWFLWMSVHLMFLLGMRNRIGVFLSWMWSYCRWQRGARIIVDLRAPATGTAPDAKSA